MEKRVAIKHNPGPQAMKHMDRVSVTTRSPRISEQKPLKVL